MSEDLKSGKIVIWLGEDPLDLDKVELSEFIAEVKEWQRTNVGWPVDDLDLVCRAFEQAFLLSESNPDEFEP